MKKTLLTQRIYSVSGRFAVASGLFIAGMAAAHADAAAAVTAALADGEAVVGLLAPGLIAIAALMLGVGLVVRWVAK